MKRFFKKASLLLVVLCLVVGSVLPSFAAIRSVNGVITFFENRDIATGNGTATANTFKYFCFTGAYDDETNVAHNFAVRAECRGPSRDTHRTELFIDVETEYINEGALGYYYEVIEKDNYRTTDIYYNEAIINSEDPAKQRLIAYSWIDFTAVAGGEDWDEFFCCRWKPTKDGWSE